MMRVIMTPTILRKYFLEATLGKKADVLKDITR